MSRTTIGSSDAAAVLGLHRYRTPWAVWARLTGLATEESSDSPAATRGRRLEPALVGWYAQETGAVVTPGPAFAEPPMVRAGAEWATCHPDGLTDEAIVEAKTAGRLDEAHGWTATDIPIDYRIQGLWLLAVVPRSRVDVPAFGTWHDDFRIYRIPADERRIVALFRTVSDWREKYVLTGEPPPVDGSEDCTRTLRALYPDAPAKSYVDPGPADLALARDLARVREQIATLETKKAKIDNMLRARIGDAYGLRGIATWAPSKERETIDAKRLRAERPEIAAEYTKVGEPGRAFRFNFTATRLLNERSTSSLTSCSSVGVSPSA